MNKYFLCISFFVLLGITINMFYSNIKETFTNFTECRKSGYTKEFCVQTPISAFGPSVCQCADGTIGKLIPGMQGECYCGDRFF
jgi:hypothetical protein